MWRQVASCGSIGPSRNNRRDCACINSWKRVAEASLGVGRHLCRDMAVGCAQAKRRRRPGVSHVLHCNPFHAARGAVSCRECHGAGRGGVGNLAPGQRPDRGGSTAVAAIGAYWTASPVRLRVRACGSRGICSCRTVVHDAEVYGMNATSLGQLCARLRVVGGVRKQRRPPGCFSSSAPRCADGGRVARSAAVEDEPTSGPGHESSELGQQCGRLAPRQSVRQHPTSPWVRGRPARPRREAAPCRSAYRVYGKIAA